MRRTLRKRRGKNNRPQKNRFVRSSNVVVTKGKDFRIVNGEKIVKIVDHDTITHGLEKRTR